jgi:hypothetical protein
MDLPTLRSDAYNATNQTADMQAAAPGLLTQLKQNLVGIFAKDNPIIDARNGALSDYLSSNANTRASLLPSNTGTVPGEGARPLTYSPTQQDAIVSSTNAAKLAPLAGWNEILKGMYGNIGDLVQGAGSIYDSTLKSNATRASGLMDLYKQAAQEDQFNRELAVKKQAAGGDGIDLASIIAAIQQMTGTNAPQRPPLESFETADKQPAAKPQPKVNLSATTKTANLGGGGNQLMQTQPSVNNSGWIGSAIGDWLKGFSNPAPSFKSLSQLGL